MIVERIPEISQLTTREKWILAGELWDEIAADPDAVPMTEAHGALVRERWEDYMKHPERVVLWDELKERIGKK